MARGGDKAKGIDRRGNARDRARRRAWLWSSAPPLCFHCGADVERGTFEVDRWPVPGHLGGSYRRGNVVIACRRCNGTKDHPPSGRFVVPASMRIT